MCEIKDIIEDIEWAKSLETEKYEEDSDKKLSKIVKELEKSIPRKVLRGEFNSCPECIAYVSKMYHYRNCGNCGQKLDWE